MGVHEDFGHLQAVSDQFAPQPHHHTGPSLGTLIGGGLIAALIYRNAQHRAQVRNGTRPGNLKEGSVLIWYLIWAAVVHVLLGSALMYFIWAGPVPFWLVYGSLIWIPAWILGVRHQRRENDHNEAVWDRFNAQFVPVTPEPVQAPRISQGFDAWYQAQKHQN